MPPPSLQHHPVYPTPQGALFQKYVSSLTSELLPVSEQGGMHPTDPSLKNSLSILSVASTGSSGSSSRDYNTPVLQGVGGSRRISPWTSPAATTGSGGLCASNKSGGSRSSRDASPASVDNLSMDELDIDVPEAEETAL